jgi:hypothetical protein
MLGSNPTRDSRMRRHHADGEDGRKLLSSLFLYRCCLRMPQKTHSIKWGEATSLSTNQKMPHPLQLKLENLFRLI